MTQTLHARSDGEFEPDAYNARNLLVLEGLEAVRKRPGMYIGSTDSRGLIHCLWEIIDNAVDEALGGHCTHIDVELHPDGSVEVRDDGRGIPVDIEPRTGLSGVEVVMTRLHAGGKFGGGSYAATGGLHGVGASVVNALSARLDVEVDRDGKTHAMSFRRGTPGTFGNGTPDSPFVDGSGVRVTGKVPKKRTGTRVRYWPDTQIFLRDASISIDELHNRARQTAFLVPGLTLVVRDARRCGAGRRDVPLRRRHQRVLRVPRAGPAARATRCACRASGDFTETVPVLDDKGHMTSTEVQRDLEVDVALRWGTGYDSTVRSFVNIIATPKGGTHVQGFERSLTKTLNEVLRAQRVLRAAEDDIVKDDALEGLTAIITVRLAEPQFEGQTKEVLGTSAASRIVASVVGKELKAALTNPRRGGKQAAKALLDKVAAAARTRIAARQHKELQRRKNALETSSLPAKLADCRSDDVERSELFIVEGDSALGTAKLARDSEIQALLPIRGKILNVQKASASDMLKNAECAAIIQVIGAGSGRTFDLASARYGRVILMADADVDGAHIRMPAAHPVLPLHAPARRGRPGVRRRPAAAPDRGGQRRRQEERRRLHLHRGPDAQGDRRPPAQGQALQGADPALQGPRRDGRQPARGDDDGPAPPDAAPGHPRRRRGGRAVLRAAHGQRRQPAAGLHRGRRLPRRPRRHRRLTDPRPAVPR